MPNNMQAMFSLFQNFRNNPIGALSRRFNIPAGINGDPNAVIQHLLSTGQITQDQFNQASMMARRIQNDPNFSKFLGQK